MCRKHLYLEVVGKNDGRAHLLIGMCRIFTVRKPFVIFDGVVNIIDISTERFILLRDYSNLSITYLNIMKFSPR